tara:strand:+ start:753 stop:1010 length:258 start_codon:yes stop_codon:yes gene_type:complete
MTKKKAKPERKMKSLEQDPCSTCLYGKNRNQHNVPSVIKNFNRVTPKEAFGTSVKRATPKPSKKARSKVAPKGKPKNDVFQIGAY